MPPADVNETIGCDCAVFWVVRQSKGEAAFPLVSCRWQCGAAPAVLAAVLTFHALILIWATCQLNTALTYNDYRLLQVHVC